MVQETICGKNAAHTLAYSLVALQEMNLAYKYPIIFWNTANLIVDSGAMNLEDEIMELNKNDSDTEDEDLEEEKIKNSSTDYGKIATAIGKMKSRGLNFSLPDINYSKISFSPNIEKNQILYGLRGITRVGNQIIREIILKRPYSSMKDFLEKIKVNKLQMIALIKSGAFDSFYNGDRIKAMEEYLFLIAEPKKRVTLQNMGMLIRMELLPAKFEHEIKIFNFNKYIKHFKEGSYYNLDSIAFEFFNNNYNIDILEDVIIGENNSGKIKQLTWDALYKKEMNPVRDWMKSDQKEILDMLNNALINEERKKYALGSISKWEMDSLSFYYHEHELIKLKNEVYGIEDFNKIKENDFEKSFKNKDGTEVNIYKIHRIAGTVIDKDKNKGLISLLTTTGVVLIKLWKSQFTEWDKQISKRNPDGTKTVVEKSFFTRGNKLIITGIKREDNFIPKLYKSTPYPLFERIDELSPDGFILSSTTERTEIEED